MELAREFQEVDSRMTTLRREHIKKKFDFKRKLHTQEFPQNYGESESVAACRIVHRADRLLNTEQELC